MSIGKILRKSTKSWAYTCGRYVKNIFDNFTIAVIDLSGRLKLNTKDSAHI